LTQVDIGGEKYKLPKDPLTHQIKKKSKKKKKKKRNKKERREKGE